MKKRYLWILALAALPPALAAASQFHHIPGAVCATSFNDGTLISRGAGIANWSTSSASVSCGVDITSTTVSPITVNPSTVRVDYVDLNDDPSFGALACQLTVLTSTGTSVSSAYQYSCATSGGCPSGANSFTGVGFLTIPDTIASTANVVAVTTLCSIPYLQSGGGTTTVYGIGVATTTP